MIRTAAIAALLLTPLAATPAPLAAQSAPAASEDARLTAFLDAEFASDLKLRPQQATRLGMAEGMDRWDDNSEAGQLRRLQARRASVARMKARFDPARLSFEGRTNYDMWAGELERMELQYRFRRYQPPFYSTLYSAHTQLPDFLINSHTVKTAADMRAWIARVRAMPARIDAGLALTRASQAQGIRVPKFQVERIIASSTSLTRGAPFDGGADSALFADAKAKIARLASEGKVTAAQAAALTAQARAAVLATKPVYGRVAAWAQSALAAAPSGAVGAGSLPGGADWYAAALRLNTTLPLTAAEIHRIGRAEVARIEGEQDALARSAGLADRSAFYADRDRRFPAVPWTDALRAEYLAQSNAVVAEARAALPQRFAKLPAHRMEVVHEPAFSEVPGGAAHASGPSPDGSRPGRTYVHLAGTTTDPAKIASLMCHEAVPGHVMQGDIAVRQTGVPKFRTTGGYVAYGEGWALYAELLCKEMGVFDTAEDFMRLDAELFRAARLVTDTGLHALGWTEDQAVEYMIASGRRPPEQACAEVRRYITLPGQATGYKIGMIKIMELRDRARTKLGPRYDDKGFNDLVVGGGGMPLSVLESRVDEWIARQG